MRYVKFLCKYIRTPGLSNAINTKVFFFCRHAIARASDWSDIILHGIVSTKERRKREVDPIYVTWSTENNQTLWISKYLHFLSLDYKEPAMIEADLIIAPVSPEQHLHVTFTSLIIIGTLYVSDATVTFTDCELRYCNITQVYQKRQRTKLMSLELHRTLLKDSVISSIPKEQWENAGESDIQEIHFVAMFSTFEQSFVNLTSFIVEAIVEDSTFQDGFSIKEQFLGLHIQSGVSINTTPDETRTQDRSIVRINRCGFINLHQVKIPRY